MTLRNNKVLNLQAHIAEDLRRYFGGLERNGVQTQLVTAVTNLRPRLLVTALKVHTADVQARTQRRLPGWIDWLCDGLHV